MSETKYDRWLTTEPEPYLEPEEQDPDVLRDAERDAELELEACPQCDGAPVVLGTLGTRQVLRCRQCGWTF